MSVVSRISAGFLVVVLVLLALSLYMAERNLDEQQRLVAGGDFEGAIEKVQLAARLAPFSSEPLQEEAQLLQRQGRIKEAEDALRRAIRRDPRNYTSYLLLAQLQASRLNDYAAAEETYRNLLEINPNSTEASAGLAQVLLRQGDLEGAKRQYEKLRETETVSLQGLYDLGRIYIRTGEPEEAVQTLVAARELALAGLGSLDAPEWQQRIEFIESIDLSIADALVVQERYAEAREIVAGNPSEQAPAILALLDTDPEMYRQSVLNSEIY
ncbi:MAG: tetratricopeptide repeat protein [Rubrobacteraceae bacterium]